jgi:hypothetical protein
MSSKLDPFNEDVLEIMAAIDDRLASLRVLIDDTMATTEEEIRAKMNDIVKRLAERRVRNEAARAELTRSADRENTVDQIAEWRRTRDTSKLHLRADRLERSAAAAMYVAATAMEEAARACLVALLARREAIALQVRQAEEP